MKLRHILTDVNIQEEYDGVELSELIQKIRTTPIIFITSLADDMTFNRIKRTQPNGFLLKPFNEILLQRSIELVVDQLSESEKETNAPEGEFSAKEAIILK